MDEGRVDRKARAGNRWRVFFLLIYCAAVVYCLANQRLRIFGVLNVPLAAYLMARLFVKAAIDDVPQWWRRLAYRGWHGNYRAFEDRQVRVIDGHGHMPSRVFAADIFGILGLTPSAVELAKLEARYGPEFVRGTEGPAEGAWIFSDVACLAYVQGHMDDQRSPRGRTARKLALWLERSVFMPIDNRRTSATGTTFPFTKDTVR